MLTQGVEEKAMKSVAVILITAALMSGCINGKFIKKSVANQCDGTGWTHTIVHYGDSRVVVIPLSEVVAGQEFRFYLVPQLKGRGAVDYSGAKIKIAGKPPADSWFSQIEGDAGDVFIHTCVDDSLEKGDTFEYKVEVFWPDDATRKALLDPRGVVIRQ
jgi:hypothetical protein